MEHLKEALKKIGLSLSVSTEEKEDSIIYTGIVSDTTGEAYFRMDTMYPDSVGKSLDAELMFKEDFYTRFIIGAVVKAFKIEPYFKNY